MKTTLKRVIPPVAFLMFLIVYAFSLGCSSSESREGYLALRLNADPSTLDPALITDLAGGSIAAKLFNGLVRLDEKVAVIPDIAEMWDISSGGTVYTFHLRKGVCFSNGREVTAQDFKYSLERIMAPMTKSPNTWLLDQVKGAREFREGRYKEISGIKAEGRYSLQITLMKPFSPFISMLTMPAASVVPREEVEKQGADFSSYPVGTGPFTLKVWHHNATVTLERNNSYFLNKPILNGILYKVIPEDLTAVTEFELGNLDILVLPASAYSRFAGQRKWQPFLLPLSGLNTYYLGLNTSRPPFDDPEVRWAVASAIDRRKILNSYLEGRGSPASGPVPELLRQWRLEKEPPPYNPAKARQIIEEKGLSGVTVSMYVTADQEVMDLSEIIQSYLKEAGLVMTIRPLEWSSYKEAVNRGEADLFWLSWWADYPDGENFLFPLFHSTNIGPAGNRTRYCNTFVDASIEKGQASVAKAEKALSFKVAEEQVVDDLPLIPFWHKTDYAIVQPWVRGVKSYPVYTMDKGTGLSLVSQGKRTPP